MDPRILSWTVEPKEKLKHWNQLAGLPLHLLEMEPRIRVFGFADEPQENIGENYTYIPRKDVILFSMGLPTAEHEIAHMVEMSDINRVTLPDWGLASTLNSDVWKNERTIKMSTVIAAASRETRVRAIQAHLLPSSIKYRPMSSHHYWGDEVGDRFKKESFGRFKSPQDYKNWIDDLEMKTFMAWSPERIENEWIKRLNYIQNWMETQ